MKLTEEQMKNDKELKRLIWEEWESEIKESDPRQMVFKYMKLMRESILSQPDGGWIRVEDLPNGFNGYLFAWSERLGIKAYVINNQYRLPFYITHVKIVLPPMLNHSKEVMEFCRCTNGRRTYKSNGIDMCSQCQGVIKLQTFPSPPKQ